MHRKSKVGMIGSPWNTLATPYQMDLQQCNARVQQTGEAASALHRLELKWPGDTNMKIKNT